MRPAAFAIRCILKPKCVMQVATSSGIHPEGGGSSSNTSGGARVEKESTTVMVSVRFTAALRR